MGKIVEDNHVEILQLFEKNIVDGKRDEAQLALGHVDAVVGVRRKTKETSSINGSCFIAMRKNR